MELQTDIENFPLSYTVLVVHVTLDKNRGCHTALYRSSDW